MDPRGTSPAGALTHVHTLADVEVPEDLPPEVAQEIAELVATRRNTLSRWARDSAVYWGIAFAIVAAGFSVSSMFHPFAVVVLMLSLGTPWRRQLYRVLDERLRELGLRASARQRISERIERLVGRFPRADPAERPSADRLLALLAPQRDRLGAEIAAPVISPLERERDDLRLAALGYLRYSRSSVFIGWLLSAGFIATSAPMLTSGEPIVVALGAGVSFFGLLTGGLVSVRGFGEMRRAIPHAGLSLRRSWKLWRKIRGAAQKLDRKLPDTDRAEQIALALTRGDDEEPE